MAHINRAMVNRVVSIIEERAKSTQWTDALHNTHAYKEAMMILAKDDEDISYVDKEMLGLHLELLSICQGLNYYQVLCKAGQELRG